MVVLGIDGDGRHGDFRGCGQLLWDLLHPLAAVLLSMVLGKVRYIDCLPPGLEFPSRRTESGEEESGPGSRDCLTD